VVWGSLDGVDGGRRIALLGMRIAVLLAATVTSGMMAGLFYAYSISVMPALRKADDAVFVEVMQRINSVITNGWFALCFGGAVVFSLVAAVLYRIDGNAAVFVPGVGGACAVSRAAVVDRPAAHPTEQRARRGRAAGGGYGSRLGTSEV